MPSLTIAKAELLANLTMLPIPHIDSVPEPEQILALGDLLRGLAWACDRFVNAVGEELKSNAPMAIDLKNFRTPFHDSLEGYALFDVASVAEECALERNREDDL